MNNRNSMIIAILALLIGIGGISFGIKSGADSKSWEDKYAKLEERLNASSGADEGEFDIPANTSIDDDTMIAGLLEQIETLQQKLTQSQTLATTRSGRRGAGADMGGRPAMPEGMDMTAMAGGMDRADMQERMQQQNADRIDALSNWDTSGMTADQLANHNALVDALAAMNADDPQASMFNMFADENVREMIATEREAVMSQLETMSDDERAAAMGEIGQMLMMGGRGNRGGGAGGFGGGAGGFAPGGFGGAGGAGGFGGAPGGGGGAF